MAIITKSRTLRPSTRKLSSPYRVHTDKIGQTDTLILTIYHEKEPGVPIKEFEIKGSDISGKNSIHFTALRQNGNWDIKFSRNLKYRLL
jgi:hypothetical protein